MLSASVVSLLGYTTLYKFVTMIIMFVTTHLYDIGDGVTRYQPFTLTVYAAVEVSKIVNVPSVFKLRILTSRMQTPYWSLPRITVCPRYNSGVRDLQHEPLYKRGSVSQELSTGLGIHRYERVCCITNAFRELTFEQRGNCSSFLTFSECLTSRLARSGSVEASRRCTAS